MPQVYSETFDHKVIHYQYIHTLMARIKLFYEKDTEHAGLQTYRFLSLKNLISSARRVVSTHNSCLAESLYPCAVHYILFRFIPDIKQLASHTDPDPAVV